MILFAYCPFKYLAEMFALQWSCQDSYHFGIKRVYGNRSRAIDPRRAPFFAPFFAAFSSDSHRFPALCSRIILSVGNIAGYIHCVRYVIAISIARDFSVRFRRHKSVRNRTSVEIEPYRDTNRKRNNFSTLLSCL